MSSLNAGKGSVSCDVLDGGFAKLHGQDFDYYIQFYEIILGRNTKKQKVDLDLTKVGASKDISRRHARIYYDFKHHTFALEVIGKSGCYVQRVLYLPGDDPVKLDSQDLIQIGGIQFYFLRSSQHIDEYIAAQGTSQSFAFRDITYHVDLATGSVEHTPILDVIRKYKTPTPIPSKPMSATASAHQHTPIPSQPMSATASAQHIYIPSQPVSATASAQHNHIPSEPMPSSSMHPVHPDFSALHDYNCGNSHGCANGDSGTAIGTGIQRMFMKQNNRSLVGLDLNLEPIIEILEEDEDTHGCANVGGGIIVGTVTQGLNMEQNKRSFGELDLNVEPTRTLNDNVENCHGLAKGENGIIVSAGTQGANMEQKNMSFGELDLNVVPTGALNEDENGHDLVNGENGIIVGTGTQPTFMEKINRSLVELNLNIEPTGTIAEHVGKVEIRTDKDKENPQLRQKEENDLMSAVARIVLNHPSPNGWVHAAEVHVQLVKHLSKIWPNSTVRKYLASEAGSSSGAVEKPWHKLLELLRKCPEKFVICAVSRGTETSDYVGYLHLPVLS
ncbi:hypothetical protein ACQ4PT_029013 [Festuca glaucescens]